MTSAAGLLCLEFFFFFILTTITITNIITNFNPKLLESIFISISLCLLLKWTEYYLISYVMCVFCILWTFYSLITLKYTKMFYRFFNRQLHLAILGNYEEAAWAIIRLAPHASFLDFRNDDAQAPLHLAVLTGQSNIVRRLLVAGAKVCTYYFGRMNI